MMKNHVRTLAFAGVLALACALPAWAAETTPTPFDSEPQYAIVTQSEPSAWYPYEITTQQDGAQVLICKRFRVPAGTPVEELAETGLTRLGKEYALWGVTASAEELPPEERQITQTYDVTVSAPENAWAELKESIVYEEDGFYGELYPVDITCEEEMREDGSYAAVATYAGTVTRPQTGETVYELIYAPVAGEEVQRKDTIPEDVILYLMLGSLGLFMLSCLIMLAARRPAKRKRPAGKAESAAPTPKRTKVYVPNNDIVVGAHPEEDDDE